MNKILVYLVVQLIFVNSMYSMVVNHQSGSLILKNQEIALSEHDSILEDINLLFKNPLSKDELQAKVIDLFNQKEKEEVILDYLKDLSSSIDFSCSKQYSQEVFKKSIECNYQNILRYLLLNKKIDVNHFGPLLLRNAAQKNDKDLMNLGLGIPDIDVNGSNRGWTALIVASQLGHTEVLKLLLNAPGIEVDAAQEDKRTALFLASENGYYDIVKLLLENGADVNKEDLQKTTPVFVATQYGYTDIVKLLIENGANINQRNKKGEGLLSYCIAFSNNRIFKLLLQKNIKLSEEEKDIEKALILNNEKNNIVYMGTLECYKRILDNKWDKILSYELKDVDVKAMKLKDLDLHEVFNKLEEYLILYFFIIAEKEDETKEAVIKYNQLYLEKYNINNNQVLQKAIKKYYKNLTKKIKSVDI